MAPRCERVRPVLASVLALLLGAFPTASRVSAEEGELTVAEVESAKGLVEVYRYGEWHQASVGDTLLLDDEVRTDAAGAARLRFMDGDPASGAETTVLDLGAETHVRVHELALESGPKPSRSGFMDLVRGALHAITKGWGSGSMFSVRAGTTICGIRGSVANVAYDPTDEAATVTSLDGEILHFEADDLETARARHHEAREHHRLHGRHPGFAGLLEIGHQTHRARGRDRVLRRIDPEKVRAAREAILQHRHPGGHLRAAGLVHDFARVRPTGLGPRKPPTRRLADRVRERLGPGGRLTPADPGSRLGPGGRLGPGSGFGPDRRPMVQPRNLRPVQPDRGRPDRIRTPVLPDRTPVRNRLRRR